MKKYVTPVLLSVSLVTDDIIADSPTHLTRYQGTPEENTSMVIEFETLWN